MGAGALRAAGETTTTEKPDWTRSWHFFFFEFERPGATIFIAGISIVHSLFHMPHMMMYRRLGILTAFWSIVGVGLLVGAVMEQELLYDVWIWYSSVYVPVMILIMCVVLTASVWALDLRLFRALIATFAVIFYLFMFYCIIFVQTEKRKIFSTTTMTSTTTTPCPWCPICLTGTCTVPTSTSGKRKLRTFELLQLGNL
ncbi:uncharacterized protein LOC125232166 isoform X1 [Leguminivora glycinivorella]|uniref:uncharacterized protein LOC125232166 isoform X1 n=1 Tax=Leguminivora glycinivorella TaxID=1035111 RepID=UPI00200C1209|nr:uncharacterized protein LOC125232166 isoform X1 [Leguminivora glycinivorella]